MTDEAKKKALEKGLEDAELIDFDEKSVPWSTWKLSDGTTLKLKIILKQVLRTPNHDIMGLPIYATNQQIVMRMCDVPPKLRKKSSKPGVT